MGISGCVRSGVITRFDPQIRYTRGMDEKSTSRRSVFAVWRWPLWAWAVAAAVFLHQLLAVPVIFLLFLSGYPDLGDSLLGSVFYPTLFLANNSEWYTAMLNWQWTQFEYILGCPKSKIIFGPLDSTLGG